jgi:Skp1 family, dimerisation domain
MIKGKTPEEIRKLFNIVNDFTPEEEVSSFLLELCTVLNRTPPYRRRKSKRRMYVLLIFRSNIV